MRAYILSISIWIANGAFFVIGLLTLNPMYVNICEKGAENTQQHCSAYNVFDLIFRKIGEGLFDAAFWTAAATIAVAVFTYTLKRATDKLWAASKEQTLLTREALEATERAFVFVKHHSVLPPSEHNSIYVLQIHLQNTGKTPTRHARGNASIKTFQGEIPEEFNFPDIQPEKETAMLIGPDHSITNAVEVPPAIIDAVAHGKFRLYMWGWIDYNDVFKGTLRHRTEFCFEVRISAEPVGAYGMAFHPYRRHNAADDDCYRQPQAPSPARKIT
jgi:hypothetical protein